MARRRKGVDLHGWLVLDKPSDMTSNDALGKVKRLLKPKKAGHAGTLDPLATGVLPIAFGEATKTVPYAMEGSKTYRFAIRWGVSTDTLDAEGAAVASSDARPSADAICAALPAFIGPEVMQTPPAYSAIKVDGERAYDLARAGETVTLEARPIRIDDLTLLKAEDPDLSVFTMRCGKGAYVRAVVRDLAESLGAHGHVAALRRTCVGPFDEATAIGLADLEDMVHKDTALGGILPVQTALDDIPALAVTPDQAADLRQGRAIVLLPNTVHALRERFRPRMISGVDASRTVVAMLGDEAIALGDVRAGRLQPARVFQA